jgi:hypothetical protein
MTTVDNYTFARAFLQLEQALRVNELDPRLMFEGIDVMFTSRFAARIARRAQGRRT